MSKMKMVNEDRLFANAVKNMGNPDVLVEELVENARRAKAGKIDFTLDGTILTVVNDGEILEDFSKLLVLAESQYDEEICRTENPAGMGIYLILASTVSAIFKSGYKSLTLDGQRIFSDSEYRNTILDQVVYDENTEYVDGFVTVLDLGDKTRSVMNDYVNLDGNPYFSIGRGKSDNLKYYLDIDIVLNELEVKKHSLDFFVGKEGEDTLSGMKIGIAHNLSSGWGRREGVVFWHGKKIVVKGLYPFSVLVSDSHVFKPKLPDRKEIINGEEEIAAIKAEIEKQLSGEIQKFLDEDDDDNTRYAEDSKQSLLDGLAGKYNTDKVMYWDKVSYDAIKDTEYLFCADINEVDLKVINCVDGVLDESSEHEFYPTGMKTTLENEDIYSLFSTYLVVSPAPSWVRDRTVDVEAEGMRVIIHLSQSDLDKCKDIGYFQKCEKIELEFAEDFSSKNISALVEESGEYVYVTDFTVDGLYDYFEDRNSDDNSDDFDSLESYYSGIMDELRSIYKARVDITGVFAYLGKLLTTEGKLGEIASFNYSDGIIKGETTTGEAFEYEAKTTYR